MRALLLAALICVCTPAFAVSGTLQGALEEVKRNCPGYRVISIIRKGSRLPGSSRLSLHHYGAAVDFAVNRWECAYAILARYPKLGWSNDGPRCRHIHASDGRGSGVGWGEPAGFKHRVC